MTTPFTPTTAEVRVAWQDRRDFNAVVRDQHRPGDIETGREFDRWLAQHSTELQKVVAHRVATRLAPLLERAWDDGNAMGLDGWVGPERGEEPDEHAARQRERTVDRLVDELVVYVHELTSQEGSR